MKNRYTGTLWSTLADGYTEETSIKEHVMKGRDNFIDKIFDVMAVELTALHGKRKVVAMKYDGAFATEVRAVIKAVSDYGFNLKKARKKMREGLRENEGKTSRKQE